jgi:hypothetical protein
MVWHIATSKPSRRRGLLLFTVATLSKIGNKGWTIDVRWRKPTHLLIDDAPIRRKRTPIEIVQTDAASAFRHEAHADDQAIRLPNEQFSFCASPRLSISPHQLRSDKMLFGEECH